MKIEINTITEKPKAVIWLYYLAFGLGLLIAVPFVAAAIITEITHFVGRWWIQRLKEWLNIEFEL